MSSLAHSINSSDRLGIMLLTAVILHTLFILGVTFDIDSPRQENSEKALDIIVVRPATPPEKPEKADFLAQQTQQGGGDSEEKQRLTAPPAKPTTRPQPVRQVEQQAQQTPPPQPATKVITRQKETPEKRVATKSKPETPEKPRKVNLEQIQSSIQAEISQLTAEIDLREQTHSRKPRRKHINSSTQEYKYAAYLTAWRRKVENIGNLNYPDEAKRRKIYGNILMTVVLIPDGHVKSISIRKSSGHKILDDAAVRIVNLASPFAPFPENIRTETDELVITRTWQFVSGNTLFSSQ